MFKQLDVLIALCNKHQCEFLILGDGPDMHDLRRVAGSTIHFLGRVGDKEKVPLIA
jgi:glycosyltransferase involved in cell wall biosynthesis